MLEGTLATFTLPDVLRLLGLTDKTGCLRLQAGGSSGRIWVEDGQVVYAVSRTGRLPLARRLVATGVVDTDELRGAIAGAPQGAPAAARDLAVADRLSAGGAVDRETLLRVLREQVRDAVFELMRWPDGRFAFVADGPEAKLPRAPETGPDADRLLMEASRQMALWREITADIPGLDAVVGVAAGDDRTGARIHLTAPQLRVVAAVDGERTVGELVDLLGLGEFATCRLLHRLVSAGLLAVSRPGAGRAGAPTQGQISAQQALLADHEEVAADEPGRPAAPDLSLVEADDEDTATAGAAAGPEEHSPAAAMRGRLGIDPRIGVGLVDDLLEALGGDEQDRAGAAA